MSSQAHGKFLATDEGSSFYLASKGLGGQNLPPDHPNRRRSIVEVRNGVEIAAFAISNVAEGGEAWLPAVIIATARQLLLDAGYDPEDA